ncbi:MAG TPA: bifunctional metallophosphatase/5'-nucleotidase, partial [Sphingomicrobium sp.]
AVAALLLAGCAAQRPVPAPAPASAFEVQILALNDFHGNLERPDPVRFQLGPDTFATADAGGAAIVGAELADLRAGHDHTITVAAGDLIGASPLTSAYFLDEPTIEAMNLMGLNLASVGNHEFDKGSAELLRMQRGGCEKYTMRVPCRLERFAGARFQYLAANTFRADGSTIFPPSAIRRFGPIKIGFIGMTLKQTSNLVTPSGVAGLRFADEAATANALVPRLRAAGADSIVLLIHQGGKVPESYHLQDCDGLSGDILPILDRLDPAIATVVSGHTHHAYACEIERGGAKRLLTSAGKYGYFVSDLRLDFDPRTHRLLAQHARNVPAMRQGSGDPAIVALVARYTEAVAPVANRVIGRLTAAAKKSDQESESPAADLVADSMLAATRNDAQLALVNSTGIRVDLPGGDVRYKDAFAMMPFGNNLVVLTLTGAQLKTVLEQQYAVPLRPKATLPAVLAPSAGFTYAVDLRAPEGQRISEMRHAGNAVDAAKSYRVVLNNYLAAGGDGLSGFTAGTNLFDTGIIDLDALVEWIAKDQTPPPPNRIRLTT